MDHASNQLTLLSAHPALVAKADSLGLPALAGWLSFVRSVRLQAPVTPSEMLTTALYDELVDAGAILDSGCGAPRMHASSYGRFAWSYGVRVPSSVKDLEAILKIMLSEKASRPEYKEDVRLLWRELAHHEAGAYLAINLDRAGFEPASGWHVLELLDLDWAELSLGRRRYLIWSMSRDLKTLEGPVPDFQRELYRGLLHRTKGLQRRLQGGTLHESQHQYHPDVLWRHPILLNVFAEIAGLSLHDYWRRVPGDFPKSDAV